MQLEFFTAFKHRHPNAPIQFTRVHGLKPWFLFRLTEWNTCCCRYHTELKLLVTGFNDMRSDSTDIHAICLCKCQEVCVVDAESTSACMRSANVQVFGGIIDMWSSILCAKPQDSSWHKKECLLGECPNCGIQNLKICSQ